MDNFLDMLTLEGAGRRWNHQVNFYDTPENLGVQRLKIAMWKVGGIKIEHTRGNQWITEFFRKSLRHR